MKKYKIFYKNVKIGVLQINDKGQYKYTPDQVGTEQVKDNISIFYEMLVESDWRDPIPFFENRIKDAERFDQEKNISNQTDSFKLILED